MRRVLLALVFLTGMGWGAYDALLAQTWEAYVYVRIQREEIHIMPHWSHAIWWDEVANCVGNKEPQFKDVTWYLVIAQDRDAFQCGGSPSMCYGEYHGRANSIHLVSNYVLGEWLVKHEIIHALGIHDHPKDVFWRCAGHRV